MAAPSKKAPTSANASIPKRAPLLRSAGALYDRPWGVLDALGWISGRAFPTEGEANTECDRLNAEGAKGGPFVVRQIKRAG